MITIVHYHQVTPNLFQSHLNYYRKHYIITNLSDLAYDKELPPHPLFITFDDGWSSTYKLLPAFKQIPSLVIMFLTAQFIDSYINPRTKALNTVKHTLTSTQIKEMSDVVNFQSHGLTHRDITQLSDSEALHELTESRHRIEALTGSPVYAYAYPYNRAEERISRILQESGYRLARMGERMLNKPDADRYTLKSIGIPQTCSVLELRYRLLKVKVKTLLREYHVY